MPITIRPSVVKIKKPSTGEYREINALLDTDSAKTVYYGVSSTAADTQTKTVTIEGISALSDGLLVRILFTNAQSYSGVPKLMINSTAASNIKTRRGTDATNLTWKAGDVLDFVYDSSSSGFIVLDKGDIEDLNGVMNKHHTVRIVSNVDLNTLTDTGVYGYTYGNAPTITNAPFGNRGALIYVLGDNVSCGILQIAADRTSGYVYGLSFRTHVAGQTSWSPWVYLGNGYNFAPVESGGSATDSYVVGDFVLYNGALCEVISPISVGDTFSLNTNVKSVSIRDLIKAKYYFKGYYTQTIVTSTDGTPYSGSTIRLAYNDSDVKFHARILLQDMTQGVRPVITLTHNDFVNCPTFQAVGNPVLRGAAGNYADECYASHTKGSNTIIINQNNFLSGSSALLAGWGVYQIPGIVLT